MAPAFWINYGAHFVSSHMIHLLASLECRHEDQRYADLEPQFKWTLPPRCMLMHL